MAANAERKRQASAFTDPIRHPARSVAQQTRHVALSRDLIDGVRPKGGDVQAVGFEAEVRQATIGNGGMQSDCAVGADLRDPAVVVVRDKQIAAAV